MWDAIRPAFGFEDAPEYTVCRFSCLVVAAFRALTNGLVFVSVRVKSHTSATTAAKPSVIHHLAHDMRKRSTLASRFNAGGAHRGMIPGYVLYSSPG
jgi:hypothetical protein